MHFGSGTYIKGRKGTVGDAYQRNSDLEYYMSQFPFQPEKSGVEMGINQNLHDFVAHVFCMLIFRIPRALKGLSYEIDFENVDKNWQTGGTSDF